MGNPASRLMTKPEQQAETSRPALVEQVLANLTASVAHAHFDDEQFARLRNNPERNDQCRGKRPQ